MRVIIDRFEGEYAVVELADKRMVNISKAVFPEAAEGDVFNVVFDQQETTARKEKIAKKMGELFE